jgi:hypothetical protein
LDAFNTALEISPIPELQNYTLPSTEYGPTIAIAEALCNLSKSLDKPLIIFFDEADCLAGPVLTSFLAQIHAGYNDRDVSPFPWSISFIGMRDIRDCQSQVPQGNDNMSSDGIFNIVTESLILNNFTKEQIVDLYRQHTNETGQIFETSATDRVWYWSEGQPWLVNALARQAIEKDLEQDYSIVVTDKHIDAAAKTIILHRNTHIDYLRDRLKVPRIRSIIEPILYGGKATVDLSSNDTKYCLDLGLVKLDGMGVLRPANPIYWEVIIRTLNYVNQAEIPETIVHKWMDGEKVDMNNLLKEFQKFWRKNSEQWRELYNYKEAAPHLILNAFLQRVVNGNGRVAPEIALGSGRADLGIEYVGKIYPIEIKIDRGPKALKKALDQLEEYMQRSGSDEGWLVVFDNNPKKKWDKKIYWKSVSRSSGKLIQVVGC